jgi:cyclohexa-1,5-dienecarbonyl-CoA hydratase
MSFQVTTAEGIGRLILDDPPHNILTRAVLAALREGLADLARREDLRVAVLAARGPHFSVGASVPEHLPPEHEEMIPEFGRTILDLLTFPLPLVAAVRGRCLGGGCEVALAADLVAAAESAHFALPEIRLGVIPPAACALLDDQGHRGVVSELLFTGEGIDAAAAREAGLIHRVVPDDDLERTVDELAGRIARNSGAALRVAKEARIRARRPVWEERLGAAEEVYLDELMHTADALEGLTSFTEKRRPQWSHR